MTVQADIQGLYNAPINLWVEDSLTRDYLRDVWQDSTIKILIGGGNEGVTAAGREAQQSGITNVFAYVDRDYRESNRADWLDPRRTSPRFVSSVHEIENFLVDAEALAGCRLNTLARTVVDIEHRLKSKARELTWWAACRSVIAYVRENVFEGFPEHPRCDAVHDLATALNHLQQSAWWERVSTFLENTPAAAISDLLTESHSRAVGWLQNDEWRREFPGKELFRHVRGYIYQGTNRDEPTTILDSDMAKAVAQWQVENDAVPSELCELRSAMRQRVGLS